MGYKKSWQHCRHLKGGDSAASWLYAPVEGELSCKSVATCIEGFRLSAWTEPEAGSGSVAPDGLIATDCLRL